MTPKKTTTKGGRKPGSDTKPEDGHFEKIRDPKERILAVAEAVFGERGYAGARTQDIAQQAGVNKAMIHYYFESKEGLYRAMLDRILFDLIKLTQEVTSREITPDQLVEQYYTEFFHYVARHRYFSRLTPMDLGSGSPYLRNLIVNFFRPLFKRGEIFLDESISQGYFKPFVARHLLISMYGMTMSYFADAEFVRLLYDKDPTSREMLDERLEANLDMIFKTIGCPRPGRKTKNS